MACTECVRLSQIERAACYKSVHSIKFVSLLPHFASALRHRLYNMHSTLTAVRAQAIFKQRA